MTKAFDPKRKHDRELIANLAARLMAEGYIDDFSRAKRKAAHQLGESDANCLPSNSEIERALHQYLSIYQQEEQRSRIRGLRSLAVRVMKRLEPFEPRLTGPVLSGVATRYASIDLMLVADSDKEVELFLAAHRIEYGCAERRLCFGDTCHMLSGFTLEDEIALVEITVMAPEKWRALPRGHFDGHAWAKLKQVERLLVQEETEHLIGFGIISGYADKT